MRFLLTTVLLVSFLAACSGKRSEAPPDKRDANSSARRDAAPTRAMPRIPEGFAITGIEPCDTYIENQRACLENHAPENVRKPQLLGLRQIAAKWAEAAAADRREALEKTCALMIDSSKKVTSKAWGCEW